MLIASAHLSEGSEFDNVVVPLTGTANYRSNIDRQILYIAATRPMHRLDLTHTGSLTYFLQVPRARQRE